MLIGRLLNFQNWWLALELGNFSIIISLYGLKWIWRFCTEEHEHALQRRLVDAKYYASVTGESLPKNYSIRFINPLGDIYINPLEELSVRLLTWLLVMCNVPLVMGLLLLFGLPHGLVMALLCLCFLRFIALLFFWCYYNRRKPMHGICHMRLQHNLKDLETNEWDSLSHLLASICHRNYPNLGLSHFIHLCTILLNHSWSI